MRSEQIDPEIIVIAHPGDEEEELEYIRLPARRSRRAGDRAATAPRRARAGRRTRASVDAILVGGRFLRDPDFAALSRS